MGIYPNITEQYNPNLAKLADQQKKEIPDKIKTVLKQTKKVAQSFKPSTKQLSVVNESTQIMGKALKKFRKRNILTSYRKYSK